MVASMWRLCILAAACTLLTAQTDAMSAQLAEFMKSSGLGRHCKSDGLSDADCVKLLKKVCGIQDISDPAENAELQACMNRERCGEPLLSKNVTRMRRADGPATPYDKWGKSQLTYMVYNMPPRTTLSKAEVEDMTRLALGVWGCYAKLDFRPARSLADADFVVMFSPLKHEWFNYKTKVIVPGSDGYPFDGEGGTLAHCFFPSTGEKSGNLHMDNSENWSANLKEGTLNTFNVLVHELGHGLGLQHSSEFDNIMAPFYNGIPEATVDLGRWEKWAIQVQYGERACNRKEWVETFKRLFPDSTTEESGEDNPRCSDYSTRICHQAWMQKNCKKMCGVRRMVRSSDKSANAAHVCKKGALHGIFDFVDGFTYIIADGFLYRRSHEDGHVDMTFRKEIGSLWKGAPAKPTAAVYSRAAESLFLFEGKDVFVISGLHGKIDASRARVVRVTVKDPKYPAAPSAAFIKFDERDSGNVYLVKGHTAYVFNPKERTVVKSLQFRKLFEVGKYGKRIPRVVDGAYHSFQAGSQHNPADSLFFFTGSSYTLAIPDQKTGKYKIPSGTRPFSTTFLHCPQE